MLILLMLERGGLSQNANTAETKEGRVGRVSFNKSLNKENLPRDWSKVTHMLIKT